MKTALLTVILLPIWFTGASAIDIQLGIFGGNDRNISCVTGSAGDSFEQVAWVRIPNGLGLAYVTYRFEFPSNIDFTSRPVFHDQVSQVIYTDFVDGTSEWNMTFAGCPSGWIRVFTQKCVLLDNQPSRIGILGGRSMVRDCSFVLNAVTVLNEIEVNDPDCETVPVATCNWGGVKSIFR